MAATVSTVGDCSARSIPPTEFTPIPANSASSSCDNFFFSRSILILYENLV